MDTANRTATSSPTNTRWKFIDQKNNESVAAKDMTMSVNHNAPGFRSHRPAIVIIVSSTSPTDIV
jgi:hypothetical protein